MDIKLVVVRGFGPYRRGDEITEADVIAAVLASEDVAHVVRVHVASREL